ncbi:MAG: sulfatase, partial [Armatimonadetes bacterium]|nr:sulfatase [Armatimonadota bacterium]
DSPDVFIYLIDALRADHLGCYGYARDTSPAMDEFASAATWYADANTAATWTRPSVATVMTGLYPSVHGAMHITEALAEWPVLLPEMLSAHGYATWTVTTNGHTTEKWGFKQGYDGMVYGNMESAEWVNDQVGTILADIKKDQPVFMFLHTIEPHAPYAPEGKSLELFDRGFEGSCDGSLEALDALGGLNPDVSEADVEHLIDRYDADVFEADKAFREFLDLLKQFDRFDNALIILVSDHGESFLEHDTLQHSCNLNQEEMHIPLIMRFPHGRLGGVRVRQRASLIDILPTVLAEVGVAPDVWYPLPGMDLAHFATQPRASRDRPVYAEVSWHEANHLDLVAVIDEDGYKRTLDVSVDPGEFATKKSLGLWDTASDPKERQDLSSSMSVRAAYDEQLLAKWLLAQTECRTAQAEAPATVEITDEMREELQALGYLR